MKNLIKLEAKLEISSNVSGSGTSVQIISDTMEPSRAQNVACFKKVFMPPLAESGYATLTDHCLKHLPVLEIQVNK